MIEGVVESYHLGKPPHPPIRRLQANLHILVILVVGISAPMLAAGARGGRMTSDIALLARPKVPSRLAHSKSFPSSGVSAANPAADMVRHPAVSN
jgi:hypothetical protein